MKKTTTVLMMTLLLGLGASSAMAQQGDNDRPPRREGRPQGERPPGGPGRGGFRPPIVAALDTNSDGVIDQKEIANASRSLKKLDKNKDGKITQDEMRPPGRRGQGQRPPGEGDNRQRRQRPPSE